MDNPGLHPPEWFSTASPSGTLRIFKGCPCLRKGPVLYNLTADIGETTNLAAKEPKRVARMVALLRQQITNGRSTPGPKLANERPRININQRVPEFVRKQLK